MGYYSNVTILVYGAQKSMDALLMKERLRGDGIFEYREHYPFTLSIYKATHPAGDHAPNGWQVILAMTTETKWYPNYPAVDAWMRFYAEAEDFNDNFESILYSPDDQINGEYISYGEDYDDAEVGCFGRNIKHYARLERSVSLGLPQRSGYEF